VTWETADPETTNRLELRDGRVVGVLAFTTADEVPGRYRVRDATGRIEVVSADDVIGDVVPDP
jgi:hypothetical protein